MRKALEVKLLDTPGSVRAVFATLNVVDKHDDVTLPGAFGNQKVVISAYQHSSWMSALPVGKGRIFEEGQEAIFEGSFLLETQHGKDTYETVRALAADGLGEWSYGFDPLKESRGEFQGKKVRFLESLKVYEVSPVLVGAGENTRTLDVKNLSFSDNAESALAAVAAFVERAKSLADLRAKEGRVLSAANRTRLENLLSSMKAAIGDLEELLSAANPEDSGKQAVYLEFLRAQGKIAHLLRD